MAARRVLTPAQRALRNSLKLEKWVKKDVRRDEYFPIIDDIIAALKAITGEAEPRDAAVIAMLAIAVGEDESVTDHVLKRNVANPNWEAIHHTCAGALFEWYLRLKEDG